MLPPRFRSLLCLLVLLALAAVVQLQHRPAAAQNSEEAELIQLINALRASRGLAPYSVDPQLMAMAQEHSAFQASIRQSTHLHSDGRVPPDLHVVENVAGGDLGYLDPQAAVYEIWSGDPVHLRTMIGFPAGSMGVGVADDGETAYYTLEVRPAAAASALATATALASTRASGAGSGSGDGGGSSTGGTPAVPAIAEVALTTLTPRADGAVFHLVGYGQTLWTISQAYQVTIEQIRAWNNLPADSSDIYAGQKLLIYPPILPAAAGSTGATNIASAANLAPGSTPASDESSGEQPASGARFTTPAGMPASAEPARAETPSDSAPAAASLAPVIALASILTGCALLLLLLLRKTG